MDEKNEVNEFGEFVSLRGVSEMTGYTFNHVTNLFSKGDTGGDPLFRRIAVRTDESFRKVYGTRVQYVFPKDDVKRWYHNRTGK